MKKILFLISLITLIGCNGAKSEKNFIQWVDPQIGATHCRWFFYTPAALPFGMAKLAPTTDAYKSPGSWMPNGYDDRHTSIEGFAHFHEFQIGGFVSIPTTGELKTLPGTQENPDEGYRSRFDKSTEHSTPGTYEVVLQDYGVKVELTATARVGYHRYTYPESETSRVLFDVGHPQGESAKVVATEINYDESDNSLSGFFECYPEYAVVCDSGNTVKSYFYAKLDKKPTSFGMFRDEEVLSGANSIDGVGTGAYLEFSTKAGEVVEMQVGLSYTSVENAKLNFVTETKGVDFDKVAVAAHDKWNEMLGRLDVEGGTDEDKIKFYTGLYHALLGRGLASDVNGCYITHDKKIAQVKLDKEGKPVNNHYNTDGIWGGFWNLTQVWALAYPDYYNDYVNSTLDFSRHTGGWLHDGAAAGVYTNGVQTNFQGLIISAANNFGVLRTDIDYAWKTVYQNELGYEGRDEGAGRYDNEYFVKLGYVPSIDFKMANGWSSNFGCSHTLEYCFAAHAASSFAEKLGKTKEAEILRGYAEGYKLIFDKETGYIRPKNEDGTFIEDFDPMKAWFGFQEGNAVQYTWYVPHDIEGLKELVGEEEFLRRLEMTFSEAQKTQYGGNPGEFDSFSGVELLYNQGNQPCLFNPWLFNYTDKPELTQYYTRDICDKFYGTEPTHGYGYGQDEDQGQLGAWFVLASMGLFDVQGGTDIEPMMQIGSPKFDKITISLDQNFYSGEKFVIKSVNNAPENYYVSDVKLNGNEVNGLSIPFAAITVGGELELQMSSSY